MSFDVSTLTMEQRYGLQFKVDQENANLEIQNAQIDLYNMQENINAKQNNREPVLRDKLVPVTVDSFITREVARMADSYFRELKSYKGQMSMQAFDVAPPEIQVQVMQLLGVKDVVKLE